LAAVPRFAKVPVRLSLVLGRFKYTERGILDRMLLRFFTRRSVPWLLGDAAYDVVAEKVTVMPLKLALDRPPEA
jgi:hypothetical protein